MMFQHQPISAVGTPGAKYPDIAAAMAAPPMKIVAHLMHRAGLAGMTAPLAVYEVDAKLAASLLDTHDRLTLKASLSAVGLMKAN